MVGEKGCAVVMSLVKENKTKKTSTFFVLTVLL